MLGPYLLPQGKGLPKKSVPVKRQRFSVTQHEYLNAAMPKVGFQGCGLTHCPSGLH